MQIKPSTTILTPLFTSLVLALAATGFSVSAQAQNGVNARGDSVLLDMNQAYKKGDKARLTALLPQASGHALEPWAAYWELKARLEEASSAEVLDFMGRYAGSYQEDRLRNDWLLLLGQRRDWSNFTAEYPKFRMRDDKEVRCYALLMDHLQGNSILNSLTVTTPAERAAEVRKNWLAMKDADDGCTLAADRLIKDPNSTQTGMTAQDAYRKARLAMEANRPRAARNALQIVSLDTANAVAEIQADPSKFLKKRATAVSTERKEAELLALIRLALSNPDGAATQLEAKWGVHLSPEQRNWAWGAIGKQAASSLNSQAVSYYANVGKDADLSDDMLGWKVRAALRAGNTPQWSMVLGAVNAMSDEARKDPTWTYWKARALRAIGQTRAAKNAVNPAINPANVPPELQEANALFESIAGVRGFYEQLALEELGRKITVPERPAPLTAQEKDSARQNPGLKRALLAIAIGLRPEGVREWNYSTNLHTTAHPESAATKQAAYVAGSAVGSAAGSATGSAPATFAGMTDRELLAAAQLACEREVWDRCINTSERTRAVIDLEQRFPMPHQKSVVKRSGEINLDPAYVYGLIRQESRFVTDARSGVGASGLMQVMPATARWTAKKIGLTNYTADQINDRDTNIAIGTGYLKLVLDDFGGSMPMAAAAYNAGPGRPRAWRNGPQLEAAMWAENVPFAETRDYVKKVLSNTTNYAALLTGQPQSLKKRLGMVGPREGGVTDINTDLP